ncbi:MAG: hypothetical protein ACREE9_03340, partial [Stellaceae bacterium]
MEFEQISGREHVDPRPTAFRINLIRASSTNTTGSGDTSQRTAPLAKRATTSRKHDRDTRSWQTPANERVIYHQHQGGGPEMAYQDDIALMAHLMRRAGFGAGRDELEARAAKGYEATVEELLHPETQPPVDAYTLLRYQPASLLPGG